VLPLPEVYNKVNTLYCEIERNNAKSVPTAVVNNISVPVERNDAEPVAICNAGLSVDGFDHPIECVDSSQFQACRRGEKCKQIVRAVRGHEVDGDEIWKLYLLLGAIISRENIC